MTKRRACLLASWAFFYELSVKLPADSEDILKAYKDYVVWNDDLQLYYLELPLTTGTVKIWFEDEKSLKAKAGLVQTYGLGGAAFWRKGFEPAHFWQRFAKHELT